VIQLVEFTTESGVSPFKKWLESLDATTHGRVLTSILRLEAGNFSSVKGVGAGVFEFRMDFGPGYRVYFGKIGNTIVLLLGGGTKKRQQNDIAAAQERWREFKRKDKS